MKKKAPELFNKLSWGITVGVGFVFLGKGQELNDWLNLLT